MTICKMIPTGGWVGSLWIYFRSLQCSPSSALGSEEQNPTKHKKKKKELQRKTKSLRWTTLRKGAVGNILL